MSSGNSKFLIYSMGRTGGSAFQRSLRLIINSGGILGEFSSNEPVKEEVLEVGQGYEKRREKLFELLNERHKTHIGHKCNRGNLDYFEEDFERITFDLIDYYDKIVFSTRDNILKQSISNRIAVKSQIWNILGSDMSREEVLENINDSISCDPDQLESNLYRTRYFKNKIMNYLETNNKDFCKVSYESLYGVEDVEFRVRYVKNIARWLGYEVDDENLDEVYNIMDPKNKITKKDLYPFIENIEEVNLRFGSKYGYLY